MKNKFPFKQKNINESKESNHPSNYSAPEGSKRDKQLDATKADLASEDPERKARAYRRRNRMEKQEREKKHFKNKPRKGMTAHQWAHARVNAATPSKEWAVVKKSNAKKKK